MAKKKEVFSKVKAVKGAAREQVGIPKASRAIPDTKTRQSKRQQKHKATLGKMLDQD